MPMKKEVCGHCENTSRKLEPITVTIAAPGCPDYSKTAQLCPRCQKTLADATECCMKPIPEAINLAMSPKPEPKAKL